jgi:hypothetical protein
MADAHAGGTGGRPELGSRRAAHASVNTEAASSAPAARPFNFCRTHTHAAIRADQLWLSGAAASCGA